MKKNILFLVLLVSVLAVGFLPAAANALGTSPRSLEITYPTLPISGTGIETPTTVETLLPSYVAYIFYFILGASGLVALVVIVIAGFRYVASAGMPEKLSDARNQITSALLGLVILFSSFLILNTINPEFVRLPRLPNTPLVIPQLDPGVLLCKDPVELLTFWGGRQQAQRQSGNAQQQTVNRLNEILQAVRENCYWQRTSGGVPQQFDGKIKEAWTIPPDPAFNTEVRYGAILYDKSNFEGRAGIIWGEEGTGEQVPELFAIDDINVSSVRPFIVNERPPGDWFAKLYKLIFFNRDNPQEETSQPCKSTSPFAESPCQVIAEIGSMEIEGDLIVIFYRDAKSSDFRQNAIDVFTQSDSNLNDNKMGKWRENCVEQQTTPPRFYPCATDMSVTAADIF